MQVSHSRIEAFGNCPFKYKLNYLDKLTTLPNDDPTNALYLGTAVHTGLEKGVNAAIQEYYSKYPVIDDRHINEAMKLEVVIPKAAKLIPPGGEFEVKISDDDFIGFIDLLVPSTLFKREVELPNQFDLYDFKYSNNVSHYKASKQLHLYKYFFEKLNPGKFIKNMYFLFVPKVNIKQKKTEDLGQFRKRIQEELEKAEPTVLPIEYDPNQVIEYLLDTKKVLEANEFPQEQGWLCNYCDFKDYCQKGIDFMLLPKNERRNIEKIEKKVVWLYGSPFSGKTTFANQFPDPLMLNTDGNIKFVDAPYISIRNEVRVEGRRTITTLAWEIFKDTISELEKKDNDFKTIIVDLLEDTYESCRLYMYDQMGISHESDDSFRAWDKVRTEFLSTLKRLMALDYENIILISHEDASKDITKKGGDKLTSIKPNIQDKVATKVAGMVDIVARVVADADVRVLSFKTNEVIFGGGRLTTKTNEIPLDMDEFIEVYQEANKAAVAKMKGESKPSEPAKTGRSKRKEEVVTETATPPTAEPDDVPTIAEPTEPTEEVVEAVQDKTEEPVETPPSEPKTRTRRKRG